MFTVDGESYMAIERETLFEKGVKKLALAVIFNALGDAIKSPSDLKAKRKSIYGEGDLDYRRRVRASIQEEAYEWLNATAPRGEALSLYDCLEILGVPKQEMQRRLIAFVEHEREAGELKTGTWRFGRRARIRVLDTFINMEKENGE